MANSVVDKIIVNFTQGEDYLQEVGKMAQKAEDAKNLAVSSANQARSSSLQAAQSAESASESAASAALSAETATNQASTATNASQQAEMYAETAFGASAPAWDPNETYNYPTVVAYTDGNTYRCVGTNVTGTDVPGTSDQWVRITLDTDDFFDIDYEGRYMPAMYPTFASKWDLDGNGNIEPA